MMPSLGTLFSFFLLPACQDGKVSKGGKEENDTAPPNSQNPQIQYGFPLRNPDDFYQTIGVDHDPAIYPDGIQSAICLNYDGRMFPWCYDEHKGTDYLLKYSFEAMDAGSSEIIAAADGVVIDTEDGNYDRCRLENLEISCDGHEKQANYVSIEHTDGNQTSYLHMKNESVAVEIGDTVKCGDYLGLVGSSGNSAAPHLHFQVENPDGEIIDPYAGSYSQEESYWVEQGDPEGFPGRKCQE